MPGFTAYMDTPVIPTQSFADGYNLPDSEYPDGTPAIKKVVNAELRHPRARGSRLAILPQGRNGERSRISNVSIRRHHQRPRSIAAGPTVLTRRARSRAALPRLPLRSS